MPAKSPSGGREGHKGREKEERPKRYRLSQQARALIAETWAPVDRDAVAYDAMEIIRRTMVIHQVLAERYHLAAHKRLTAKGESRGEAAQRKAGEVDMLMERSLYHQQMAAEHAQRIMPYERPKVLPVPPARAMLPEAPPPADVLDLEAQVAAEAGVDAAGRDEVARKLAERIEATQRALKDRQK